MHRSAAVRRRGLFRSLGFRLTVLLAVLMILAGTVGAHLSADYFGARLRDQSRLEALRLADTIKRSTRHDMLNAQSEYRSEYVARAVMDIGSQPGIEHVRIYNKSGKVVYSSDLEEVDRVVDQAAEACNQCHSAAEPLRHLDSKVRTRDYLSPRGGRTLAAIDVVYNEPSCATTGCHPSPEEQSVLGVVDVGVSLTEADAVLERARSSTLFVGLFATALICALIGLFVYVFVTRPLRRLQLGIERVARGDFAGELPEAGGCEVGALSRAFNRMTVDLSRARTELEQWGRTLEQQVEERTRDLRIAQAQVMRAEKLSSLGTLAAGVAHELNSPLTGILTFAHLLLQDSKPGTREHADLGVIVNETQRCAAIIRQLLQFAREGDPTTHQHDIAEVVRRALALVERQALFHRVKVAITAPPDLPRVPCKPNQLQQVFLNLLINAAEAMPKGGEIHVRLTTEGADFLVVEVADNGPGIPPEYIGKIFDPFFTSKEVGKGTGLGLSVSYGIVESHGGTIAVRSKLGEGATFTVRLPTRTEPEREAPPARAES